MPSPFPGMDPYLEHPGRWPDVHHRLISVASNLLRSQLRPKYYIRIEERVYLSDESDPGRSVIIPDMRIVTRAARPHQPTGSSELIAVATVEPVEATTLFEEEIREARLEVIDRELRTMVTVIEVLSPTNKVPNSRGQKLPGKTCGCRAFPGTPRRNRPSSVWTAHGGSRVAPRS